MHTPVLLKESIDALDLKANEVFLDATFGAGGHSREVRRRFGYKVQIIGLDVDPDVATLNPNFEIKTTSFRDIDKLDIHPDAILLDLGISSDQLDKSGRGFSYLRDEPLDMRMSGKGLSAADILNFWDESAIELVLRGFGEEKSSRKIARQIVYRRELKPFATTFDLLEVVGERKGRIHPATKTFQALRIAVNEELTSLETGLVSGFKSLRPGGRLVVISFHSLEDRIVKNFFRDRILDKTAKQITKKPIVASAGEIERNPRSRSAKLRAVEKYND